MNSSCHNGRKLAKAVHYNARGHLVLCRRWKSTCDCEKSLAPRLQDCLHILAAMLSGQCIIVGYCYSSLVFSAPFRRQNTMLTYKSGVPKVKRDTFHIWASPFNDKVVVGITLDIVCGLCHPHSLLCVTSTMVNAFLRTRPCM